MQTWYEKNKKLVTLGILALVCLFLIFFVGWENDAETGKSKMFITFHGIESFRLGMDIAGGSRLTYKIDYSKYKAQFKDNFQFEQAKKTAQQIIFTQIDNRISKLGVSDYSSYPQTLNNEEYVVVELGGVTDVDEAKEKIGKTVELEFKLENKKTATQEEKDLRKQRAQDLLSQAKASPDHIDLIAPYNQSEDIYYTEHKDVSLEQLPTIYQKNLNILDSLLTGTLYDQLLEGVYQDVPSTYEDQGVKDLKGFVVVKLLDKKEEAEDAVTLTKFVSVAQASSKEPIKEVTSTKPSSLLGEVSINADSQTMTFFNTLLYSGSKAYNLTLYQQSSGATIDTSLLSQLTKENADELLGDSVSLSYEGWMEELVLLSRIPNFTLEENKSRYYFPASGLTYVLGIYEKKGIDQDLYELRNIHNIDQAQSNDLLSQMKTRKSFTLQEIFIKDSVTWIAAVDSTTNEILNGAYFEMATVGTTQLGEPSVNVQFNETGKRIFCHITEKNIGNQMAIFVGGELKTNPVIQDKICGGQTQISGSFDRETAKTLVKDLNEGALPAPLILTQEEIVSASLGSRALEGMLRSGVIGFIFIFLYIFMMYGIVQATISLAVLLGFIIYLLGFLKLMGFVISLSGLAAVILTIGMSVDANILIFERLREERARGKDMSSAIIEACERSRAPIRDGNLSTGVIALLLFTIGVNVFKGFGSMIIISILLILLVVVPLTRELLMKINKK